MEILGQIMTQLTLQLGQLTLQLGQATKHFEQIQIIFHAMTSETKNESSACPTDQEPSKHEEKQQEALEIAVPPMSATIRKELHDIRQKRSENLPEYVCRARALLEDLHAVEPHLDPQQKQRNEAATIKRMMRGIRSKLIRDTVREKQHEELSMEYIAEWWRRLQNLHDNKGYFHYTKKTP